MKPVIEINNLSKRYRISHQAKPQYRSLRDDLVSLALRPFRALTGHTMEQTEEFWALKDVSFTLSRGEVLGIIGKNGSGKSTLLKILSRITDPTSGQAVLRGNTASLLEVGTGFHPELTGRENIYFNGSILGMSKREITSKFDEIVNFAETEKFLDTPVKFYSSGMYVRLAFAVAAHLEPDILIVDEVLAVGDAQFQKKCLGKMGSVAQEGRTVIFVSHNMAVIEQLCNRGIYLKDGEVAGQGNIHSVVAKYLADQQLLADASEWTNSGDLANPYFTPQRFFVASQAGQPLTMPARRDQPIWVQIEGQIDHSDPLLTIGYALYAEDGTLLYWSYHTDFTKDQSITLKPGRRVIRSEIPAYFLNEEAYRLELIGGLHNKEWLFEPRASAPGISLSVEGGLSSSAYWAEKRPGLLAPAWHWEIK